MDNDDGVKHSRSIFFSRGAAVQREPWPPHAWGF